MSTYRNSYCPYCKKELSFFERSEFFYYNRYIGLNYERCPHCKKIYSTNKKLYFQMNNDEKNKLKFMYIINILSIFVSIYVIVFLIVFLIASAILENSLSEYITYIFTGLGILSIPFIIISYIIGKKEYETIKNLSVNDFDIDDELKKINNSNNVEKENKKINCNTKDIIENSDNSKHIEDVTQINIDIQKEDEQAIIETKEINNNTDEFTKETNKPKYKKALPLLIIALCFETIILCYVFAYTQELKTDLNNKQNQINTLNTTVINQKVNYEEIWDLREQVDFMNEYIVIVPINTSIYHEYGCQYLDLTNFFVFNVENAKNQGYVACTHCIK